MLHCKKQKNRKMSEKIKYQLEYDLKCSTKVLFARLSTPSGLSEWFADDVNLRGDIYTFIWDDSEEKAALLNVKENKHVRFRWDGEDEETYFEFRIEIHELTGDLALIVTDFAEKDEQESAIELWNSQIDNLKRAIGL